MRRGKDTGPRLAVAAEDLYGDWGAYSALPPFRMSIASPKE